MKHVSARVRQERIKLICIVLLVIGIVFRFVNLDRKVYWHDEAYTSMEVAGYSSTELVSNLFKGQEVRVADALKYQHLNRDRHVGQIIEAIGKGDPQHPPLYYILARFWMQSVGDSIAVMRSFSALLSLLLFPCIYWLCWELFASPLTGWVAVALVAISPLHLLYAQEAREYAFWTAVICFSSAALIRAMRSQRWYDWAMYTLSVIVALYTALFTVNVIFAHALYVLLNNEIYTLALTGFRLSRRTITYLVATASACVAFIPWIYILITYANVMRSTAGWVGTSLPLQTTFTVWIFNLSRIFFDADISLSDANRPWFYVFMLPIFLFELYAVYFVYQHAPKHAKIFILTLLVGSVLPLALPDLLFGGQRATVNRYLIAFFVALQLSVAYLLATHLASMNVSRRQMGKFLASILIVVGIISCTLSAQAKTWWNKSVSYDHPQIAQMINASDRPLLITDGFGANPSNVLSLSYLLNDKVRMILLPQVSESLIIPNFPRDRYSDVFLLNLPDGFRTPFEQRYNKKLMLVANPPYNEWGRLWKLEK